jgi:hypothetical protein
LHIYKRERYIHINEKGEMRRESLLFIGTFCGGSSSGGREKNQEKESTERERHIHIHIF